MLSFAEKQKVLPILAPADIVATATGSQYVDLDQAVGFVEIEVNFGAIASTDSTGEAVVTIQCSTARSSNATESSVAFQYRLSGAVATDLMGDIASATASGVAVGQADDNKTLLIYVDPSVVQANAATMRFIRAVVTPTSEITSTVVGAVARFLPRYPGNSIPSST